MSSEPQMAATAVALVPTWKAALSKASGLFILADGVAIPGDWEVKPDQWTGDTGDMVFPNPKAIPTPFARAEATRLVLAQIDQAFNHVLALRFRDLLLGVAAGVLTVEPDDLASPEHDNLGRALLQVDRDARYFCQLKWRGLSYGITYRTSLFSPHTRRTREEWAALAEAIKPLEPDALTLLCDWRASLERARRWNPEVPLCEWQRGVNEVLRRAGAQPSEGNARLVEDARLVGPAHLTLPTGLNTEPGEPVRAEPVYLPSLQRGFAARLLTTCQFKPREEPDKQAIALCDATQKTVARIRLGQSGSDGNSIALGMGSVELLDTPKVPAAEAELWVSGRGGEPGIVDLLRPVVLALQKIGRPVDGEHVLAAPALYPDPIRVLFERGRWPGEGGARAAQSRRLAAALLQAGGRALDGATLERERGERLQLGGTAAPVTLTLVDRLGEIAINDFRALGYALFAVFTREAEPASALDGQLAMADTLEKLLEHNADRPLEPRKWVYDLVELPPSERLSRRVATLQRFLRAYRSPQPGLPRVLDRAAQSFARWASGRLGPPPKDGEAGGRNSDLLPLGRPSARAINVQLPTGEELRLPLDAVEG